MCWLFFVFQYFFALFQVNEDILQYEEIMEWLHEAEAKLADVHKRFRYRNQDYAERLEFQAEFEKYDDRVQALFQIISSAIKMRFA